MDLARLRQSITGVAVQWESYNTASATQTRVRAQIRDVGQSVATPCASESASEGQLTAGRSTAARSASLVRVLRVCSTLRLSLHL